MSSDESNPTRTSDGSNPTGVSGGTEASGLADTARVAASTATSEVKGLTSQAVDQAADVLGDVRSQVGVRADAEAHRAAAVMSDIGRQLRDMAERADQDGPAARWVREAGVRTQRLADRLDEGGSQGVVDDVQRFARRRPGLFLAGVGLAGFAVGRMLRNSSSSSDATRSARPGGADIDLRDGDPGSGQPLVSSSTSGLALETPDNLSGQAPSGLRADAGGVRSGG